MSDFGRSKSNQLIITVNFVAVVLLILFLFIFLATGRWEFSAAGIVSVIFLFVGIIGTIISGMLILRKSKELEIEKGNQRSEWGISLPEKQRDKLNREVGEIANIMDITADQYSDLLLAYIVAEDLALRHVQQEAAQPLIRHAMIGETEFDAILLAKNLITCVEVTFLVEPDISPEKIDRIAEKMKSAQEVVGRLYPGSSLKLRLLIVFQLDAMGEAKLRSIVTKNRFASIPVNYFEIELRSFEELQKIYTMD